MLLVIYIMSVCTTDALNIKDAAISVCAPKIAAFCGFVVYGCVQECLLDIARQLACMKLGSREIYQPIQYCWVYTCRLLGYIPSSYLVSSPDPFLRKRFAHVQ